jgi:uncharacterized protein YbjT (DUF2867 family)
MILVVGGTGRLGTLLVRRLRARGANVRVLTRDPTRAANLLEAGAEIVAGDLRDAVSVRRAVAGTDAIISAAHGFGDDDDVSPESVDRAGNFTLIDAAAQNGTTVVLMSIVGATADHSMELFRAKHSAEQHLRASGVPWSIVRATAFIETWATIVGDPLRTSGRALVLGRGENPMNFVAVADVAALVERVVVTPELRGEVIEIGGSELTMNQLAEMSGRALERPAAPRHVPRAALRAMGLLLRPIRPAFARHARAAAAMDQLDLRFDSSPARRRFPDLPQTALSDAVFAAMRAERVISATSPRP